MGPNGTAWTVIHLPQPTESFNVGGADAWEKYFQKYALERALRWSAWKMK
jgi:hypothetical protein